MLGIFGAVARRVPRSVALVGVTAVTAGTVLVLGPTGLASAHTPSVIATCSGLQVTLTSYEGNSTNNRLTVTIDGAAQTFDFGSGLSKFFAWSDKADHNFSWSVDANRVTGDKTRYDTGSSGSKKACHPDQPVTPAAPTFREGTCTAPPTLNVPTSSKYTSQTSGTVGFGQTVTVTFAAQPGWVLNGQASYSHTYQPAPSYGQCHQPPATTPPTVTPVCGANNDTVSIPPDTSTVDYVGGAWANGMYTVTALWIPDGRSVLQTWTFTDDNVPCKPTEWPEPTAAPVCGTNNDTVTVPNDTDDVHYDTVTDGATTTVTAQWTYDHSVLQTWTFTDDNVPCKPTEWPEPTAAPVCGTNNDTVTVPNDTDDVHYDTVTDGATTTVTAQWTYDHSALQTWTFTDDNVPCKPTEWPAPTAAPVCGTNNDTVTVPNDTDDVHYDTVTDGATTTVTAQWTYDHSVLQTWTFTDDNVPCKPTEWPEPTAAPVCGTNNDTVTVPNDTDDVHYDTVTDGATTTVTAQWTYDHSVLQTWTFTDDNEACSTTTTTTEPSTTTTTTEPSTTTTTEPSTTTTTEPSTTTTEPVVPTLRFDVLTPVCDNDAPYLEYSIEVTGTPITTASITFVNPFGNDVVYFNLPLSGRVLWPGAAVDANGTPTDWPGWTQLADGSWQAGDAYDWARSTLQVIANVNPTGTAIVSYPAATPGCAANPTGVDAVTETDDPGVAPQTANPALLLPQTA